MSTINTTAAISSILSIISEDSLTARVPSALAECSAEEKLDFVLKGARSQADIASITINLTSGQVTSDELGDVLAATFPSAKVGPRHGKHYLSLARTGKLSDVDDDITIPKAARKGRPAKMPETVEATHAAIEKLQAQLDKLNDHLVSLEAN